MKDDEGGCARGTLGGGGGQARTGFDREICEKGALGVDGRKLNFIYKE